MRAASVWIAILLIGMPVVGSGQQSSLTSIPLVITDKAAVEEWAQALGDLPEDSDALRSDTAFLLSLSETELAGRYWFRQRCALCHVPQSNFGGPGPNPLGPVLTQRNVVGREDVARRRILEGSARMPAYKYGLEPAVIESIITFLKRVEPAMYGDGQ